MSDPLAPFCIDCKHSRRNGWTRFSDLVCLKFPNVDIVEGVLVDHRLCQHARSWGACGPAGLLYEAKADEEHWTQDEIDAPAAPVY